MSRTLSRPVGIAVMSAALVLGTVASGATVSAQDGDIEACIAEATAIVEEARAPLEVLTPPSDIDIGQLSGSSVWLIAAGQTEFVQTVADGFEAAGDAAGIDTRFVVADFQLNRMQQLVEQAVSANADGIVLFNVQPGAVSGQLEGAIEKGIPVVDMNNGDPTDPLEPGIFAHVAAEFTIDGQKKAAWMLADSGCQLSVATFNTPVFNVVDLMISGATAEIERLCPPDACNVDANEFNAADFATSLAPQVQTVLRRDPSIGYVDAAADAFASVVSPVLQQAGTEVKILGHDGNPSTIETMAAGNTLQVMTVAGPPEIFIGWALLDQVARAMLAEEPADWALPGRIVDETNIGTGSDEDIHPGWEGFEEGFLEAWGL